MIPQYWTAEAAPPAPHMAGWVIRHNPTPGGNEYPGGRAYALTFPALRLTDWVADPEKVAREVAFELNAYPLLLAEIKRVRVALHSMVREPAVEAAIAGIDGLLELLASKT